MELKFNTPVRVVISADGIISGKKTLDGEIVYDVTLESGRILVDVLETDLIPIDTASGAPSTDYWNDVASDAEADADALASAGHGTDEDYGDFGEGSRS